MKDAGPLPSPGIEKAADHDPDHLLASEHDPARVPLERPHTGKHEDVLNIDRTLLPAHSVHERHGKTQRRNLALNHAPGPRPQEAKSLSQTKWPGVDTDEPSLLTRSSVPWCGTNAVFACRADFA